MKIDLTLREIELILILMNEAVAGSSESPQTPLFSMEELALMEKLEMALKKEEFLAKTLLSNSNISNLQH